MSSLSVSFCGIELNNPFVVAASPATESVEGIVKCADAGAGAVITKSIADFDKNALPEGARRAYLNARGLWATSTFRRETLSRREGVALIAEAAQQTRVPIIASVAAIDLDVDSWIPTCLAVEDAGADLIQLDLFYLPQPTCTPGSLSSLSDLLDDLALQITLPVMPKLNIEIPAYLAAEYFPQTRIAAISLLDSVRVPSPVDVEQKGKSLYRFIQKPGMSSLFGSWQLPLTQHYTMILGRLTHLPLCAGGGLTDAHDALELIMLGATTVQYATAVLVRGYDYIRKLVSGLEMLGEKIGYRSVQDALGVSLTEQCTDAEGANPVFQAAKAMVDSDKCTMCGRCFSLAFCNALTEQEGFVHVAHSLCDGCGFCIHFCEFEALHLEPMPEQAKIADLQNEHRML